MNLSAIDPAAIIPAWRVFQDTLPVKIAPIQNDEHYHRLVGLMNNLLDVAGDDEAHELTDFIDLISQLVEDYECTRVNIPESSPNEILRFLMAQHGLKQVELCKEIGGQSVVSAILNGKRKINIRQARALSARFNVSPAVFL